MPQRTGSVTEVDAPLVSIVTRTLGRACLADAAASVGAQTYRPLEWVVVDAAGRNELTVDAGNGVTTRIVGTGQPLLRSAAANAGIVACKGRWICILDDDDLLKSSHVERLASALLENSGQLLAYADVEVWGKAPEVVTGFYAFGYSRLLLLRRNLFPMLAALFDATLVSTHGVRFDIDLDFFEDWDFLLQCARHTTFQHVAGVSAVYRGHLSESGILDADKWRLTPKMRRDRDAVKARYAAERELAQLGFDARKKAAHELITKGDWAAAATAWRALFEADPYDGDAANHCAECCFAMGNHKLSAKVLRHAIDLNPRNALCHWNLATVLGASGDPAEVAALRQRALQLDPSLAAHAAAKP